MSDNPSTKKTDSKPSGSSKAVEGIAVDGSFVVYPGEPLEMYDRGPAKAYKASSKKGGGHSYYALVCAKNLIPRHDMLDVYKGCVSPSLLSLIYSGVIDWPKEKEQRFILVYKAPLGKNIVGQSLPFSVRKRKDLLTQSILEPLIPVFQMFKEKKFAHGSICAENIFLEGDLESSNVISLGDCLGVPSSYLQPVTYLTVQKAMVDPIARGRPFHEDDMYALGVVLALMLRSSDPNAGLPPEEIIKNKILNGSYATLMGKDRLTGSLLELVRGLLHDNVEDRWSIDELTLWFDGRRLSPQQGMRDRVAIRPLVYSGKKYLNASLLAMDVDSDPQETERIVETEELAKWLKHAVDDNPALERLELAIKSSSQGGRGAGYQNRLVANVASALDPNAPIRFKGLRLLPHGIGKALAEAAALKKDINVFANLLSQNVVLNWIGAQVSSSVDYSPVISRFDRCRTYLKNTKPGFGIERCIYTLSPDAPCLSPFLAAYYVRRPEDMLAAFESLAERGMKGEYFLDRHSLAFLAVREPKVIEKSLYDIDSAHEHMRLTAKLRILANMQKRFSLPAYPAIGQVFLKAMPKIYTRYHDQSYIKKIEKKVAKAAKQGDLSDMIKILEDPQKLRDGMSDFKRAIQEHISLQAEYEALDKALVKKNSYKIHHAQNFAALSSAVLSIVFIVVIIFFKLGG